MIKANAYGHGYLFQSAKVALEVDVFMLAVAYLGEALYIRKLGNNVLILVMGPAKPSGVEKVTDRNVNPSD